MDENYEEMNAEDVTLFTLCWNSRSGWSIYEMTFYEWQDGKIQELEQLYEKVEPEPYCCALDIREEALAIFYRLCNEWNTSEGRHLN